MLTKKMLFIKGFWFSVVVPAALLCASVAGLVDQHYDLGGPCEDSHDAEVFKQLGAARKTGSWNRVIELEKLTVRGGCRNQYRWEGLANTLLEAERPMEALQVLEEMDSRGFDLNPSLIDGERKRLREFMDTRLFSDSPVGQKMGRLRRISDERRARYRELLKALPAEQRPPADYIARDVCPFECCRYGDWIVLEDTELVASPGSQRIVGEASRNSPVVSVTGEVHVKPEPVVVLTDVGMQKGSIAFILDSGGEGYGHVYTQGKVISEFLGYGEYCFRVSESCWGETVLPSSEQRKQVWWVKVRLANGVTGWTDQTDHFGGKDSCS